MSLANISFFLCTLFSLSSLAQKFDKAVFYQVIETKDSIKINEQLNLVQNSAIKEKQAYEGALLLKKAGAIANKKDKLATFKAGKRKLESALEKDSSNTEYRFLRLMIQENAPKILGYHNNLEKDNIYIRKNYKTLSTVLQQAILGYSKQSKTLSNLSTETK
ncbi:MAG TPA: hypothetical protein VN698_07725 [Bacteroidia bacterium]|nr:hypothetical protein [Bacteroidia bacterium]